MRRAKYLPFLLVLISCASTSGSGQESPTAVATNTRGLSHFYFDSWAGPRISVFQYVPATVDIETAPILIMMHGAKRGAARYLSEWDEVADAHGFIVVAPEFSRADFPGSASYNRGNMIDRETAEPKPRAEWTFAAIEPLFDQVTTQLGSEQSGYTFYGHSAGSQFVHRFMTFMPNHRVKRFLPANAGWYTFLDPSRPYPYGTGETIVADADIDRVLGFDVVVLLGDQDSDPKHPSLRRSAGAMQQGPHRFARGQAYFQNAKAIADRREIPFGWRLRTIPGVAHQNGGIARSVGDLVR